MCPCSYHSYDVFLTKEPNAYEAMALVHSRVRRVVFGIADTKMGGLGGVSNEVNGIRRYSLYFNALRGELQKAMGFNCN